MSSRESKAEDYFEEPSLGAEHLESETFELTKAKRKCYGLAFKTEAIEYAERHSNLQAISGRQATNSTVASTSEQSGLGGKRLPGAGRPLRDLKLDKDLFEWIKLQRAKKHSVSRRIIKKKAKELSSDESFKISNGWLEKFLRRHNLVTRHVTSTCQKPSEDLEEHVVNFVLKLAERRRRNNYQNIFAADETGVSIEPVPKTTITEKGASEVRLITTGHEKLCITVMLTARDDGYKCRPFVILPRVRPDKRIVEKYKNKLELCWSKKSWMNDANTAEYLQKVLGSTLFGKRLLIWDQYAVHKSKATMKKLDELRIDSTLVPAGCTPYIQVRVNSNSSNNGSGPGCIMERPIQKKIQEQYEDWLTHESREYTKAGNPRAPSMDKYLGWIARAWHQLTKDMIVGSFKSCGISNALDGSEDSLIHCFKSDASISTGLSLLQKRREEETAMEELSDLTLEENEEDSYSPIDFEE